MVTLRPEPLLQLDTALVFLLELYFSLLNSKFNPVKQTFERPVMKSKMQKICLMGFLVLSISAHAGEISGVIELTKGIKKMDTSAGALFIFAKKPSANGQVGMPPVAVLKIATPQFPVKFSLTEKNVMMPGTPFEGPLTISARYSPSGDALDKSGLNGTDEKNGEAQIGNKKILIQLKK